MDESVTPQPAVETTAEIETALERGLAEIQALQEQIERDHARTAGLKAETAGLKMETDQIAARIDMRLREMAAAF